MEHTFHVSSVCLPVPHTPKTPLPTGSHLLRLDGLQESFLSFSVSGPQEWSILSLQALEFDELNFKFSSQGSGRKTGGGFDSTLQRTVLTCPPPALWAPPEEPGR